MDALLTSPSQVGLIVLRTLVVYVFILAVLEVDGTISVVFEPADGSKD